MQSAKPNQALTGWFSGLGRLPPFVAGCVFHTGLICANLTILCVGVRAIYCLSLSGPSKYIRTAWLGMGLQLYCFAPVYYQVLSPITISTLWEVVGLCLVFIAVWRLWWIGYQQFILIDSTGVMPVFWLFVLQVLWSGLGIGFYQLPPLLANTPFEGLIDMMGDVSVWLVLLCLHQQSQLRCYIGLGVLLAAGSLLSKDMPVEHGNTDWLSDITIYAEGLGHEVASGNAIVARRVYEGDSVFHASVGIGEVIGMSVKQHLVPLVESGYTPKKHSRVLNYQGHQILVLICNDVLFQDFTKDIAESEVIVVLSHLSDLAQTPILPYFQQYLRYLSRYYGLPVYHVDQDFKNVYGVAGV